MASPVSNTPCPRCATEGTGRFCAECGAPLNAAPCQVCGATLSAGAKFCHHCGATAGAGTNSPANVHPGSGPGSPNGATSAMASILPWAVAGIAFLALFAMLAGKGLNNKRGSALDAPANALPNPALDGGGPNAMAQSGTQGMSQGGPGAIRAPDISNMKPSELAERLFNKVMLLSSQGKSDSVQFFAPMAIQAYSMMVDQQGHPLELDQRYDVGRIAEAAGALPLAKAQADTILQQAPDHLLGLLLAGQVAKLSGNTTSFQEYRQHFTRVKQQELAKDLPEYTKHRTDIAAGL